MEWLKEHIGEELYNQVEAKLKGNKKVQLANLAGGAYVTKEDMTALEAANADLQKQLKDRDTQLDALKGVDAAALKDEIARLQGENAKAQADYDAKLKQITLDAKLETLLVQSGAVNSKAVKALLDPSKISLDGENLVGLDEQMKALKEKEPWAFKTAEVPGAGGNPAAGGGDTKALPTGVQIL